MTVCSDCVHAKTEEVTNGLYEDYCDVNSDNFLTEDGCCYYDERKDDE